MSTQAETLTLQTAQFAIVKRGRAVLLPPIHGRQTIWASEGECIALSHPLVRRWLEPQKFKFAFTNERGDAPLQPVPGGPMTKAIQAFDSPRLAKGAQHKTDGPADPTALADALREIDALRSRVESLEAEKAARAAASIEPATAPADAAASVDAKPARKAPPSPPVLPRD